MREMTEALRANKQFHYSQYNALRCRIDNAYKEIVAGSYVLVFCTILSWSRLTESTPKTRFGIQWFVTFSLVGIAYRTCEGLNPRVIEQCYSHREKAEYYTRKLENSGTDE